MKKFKFSYQGNNVIMKCSYSHQDMITQLQKKMKISSSLKGFMDENNKLHSVENFFEKIDKFFNFQKFQLITEQDELQQTIKYSYHSSNKSQENDLLHYLVKDQKFNKDSRVFFLWNKKPFLQVSQNSINISTTLNIKQIQVTSWQQVSLYYQTQVKENSFLLINSQVEVIPLCQVEDNLDSFIQNLQIQNNQKFKFISFYPKELSLHELLKFNFIIWNNSKLRSRQNLDKKFIKIKKKFSKIEFDEKKSSSLLNDKHLLWIMQLLKDKLDARLNCIQLINFLRNKEINDLKGVIVQFMNGKKSKKEMKRSLDNIQILFISQEIQISQKILQKFQNFKDQKLGEILREFLAERKSGKFKKDLQNLIQELVKDKDGFVSFAEEINSQSFEEDIQSFEDSIIFKNSPLESSEAEKQQIELLAETINSGLVKTENYFSQKLKNTQQKKRFSNQLAHSEKIHFQDHKDNIFSSHSLLKKIDTFEENDSDEMNELILTKMKSDCSNLLSLKAINEDFSDLAYRKSLNILSLKSSHNSTYKNTLYSQSFDILMRLATEIIDNVVIYNQTINGRQSSFKNQLMNLLQTHNQNFLLELIKFKWNPQENLNHLAKIKKILEQNSEKNLNTSDSFYKKNFCIDFANQFFHFLFQVKNLITQNSINLLHNFLLLENDQFLYAILEIFINDPDYEELIENLQNFEKIKSRYTKSTTSIFEKEVTTLQILEQRLPHFLQYFNSLEKKLIKNLLREPNKELIGILFIQQHSPKDYKKLATQVKLLLQKIKKNKNKISWEIEFLDFLMENENKLKRVFYFEKLRGELREGKLQNDKILQGIYQLYNIMGDKGELVENVKIYCFRKSRNIKSQEISQIKEIFRNQPQNFYQLLIHSLFLEKTQYSDNSKEFYQMYQTTKIKNTFIMQIQILFQSFQNLSQNKVQSIIIDSLNSHYLTLGPSSRSSWSYSRF